MAEKFNLPILAGRELNRKVQEVRWIFPRLAVQAKRMLFLCLVQYTMVSRDVKYQINEIVVAARPKQALNEDPAQISWIAMSLSAAQ